jgi:pilus assembly protein CpaB
MILRLAFFALMSLGLLGFGTVAWVATRPPPPDPAVVAASAKVNVLVTTRAIRPGNLLKPEDLKAMETTRRQVGEEGTIDTPDARRALVGAMVRSTLSVGDAIRTKDVMHPGDHGFLAAVLGPGMRAISVSVDVVAGAAGLIWPGDRVDVILTQQIADPTLPVGRRIAAETILADTRVIAIDQQIVQGVAPDGAPRNARTVTLEVPPNDAERVSVAMRVGRLSLSVRSVDGASRGEGGAYKPELQTQTNPTWASDVSAALGRDVARGTSRVLRVFQGSADGKEFQF